VLTRTHVQNVIYILRYGVAHKDFSPETFPGGYGIGEMRCTGDEASLVDCNRVEISDEGIDTPDCENNNNDRDVGIVCGMTCDELY